MEWLNRGGCRVKGGWGCEAERGGSDMKRCEGLNGKRGKGGGGVLDRRAVLDLMHVVV